MAFGFLKLPAKEVDVYADHDLVRRAMQPYENLLHQARNERLIRYLRFQQAQGKTAIPWLAALGDRLVAAGQRLNSAAQVRDIPSLAPGFCDEVFERRY